MPTYDYRCDANGLTLEARHSMSRTVRTWGELCELLEIDPGSTPISEPVRRIISGGAVLSSGSLGEAALPPCQGGGGPPCGRGACGL